jgi:hypothetical protein
MIGALAIRWRSRPPIRTERRQMHYVSLGASGLRVSRVCLGMMGFGNDSDKVAHPVLGHA